MVVGGGWSVGWGIGWGRSSWEWGVVAGLLTVDYYMVKVVAGYR